MDTDQQKTHLSNVIDAATESKLRYDTLAKEVLGDKQILARIMQRLIPTFQGMPVDQIMACIEGEPVIGQEPVYPGAILGSQTENAVPNEGRVTFDILCQAYAPAEEGPIKIYINLEAQDNFHPGYDLFSRGIFYGARLLSRQLDREFTDENYDELKKVYSIWICFDATKNARHAISEVSLKLTKHHGDFGDDRKYDYMSVFFVGIDKEETGYADDELIDLLTALFSEKLSAAERLAALETRHDIPQTLDRKERLGKMCNLSSGIEARGLEKGRKLGIQEGVQQGIRQGVQQGIRQGVQQGAEQELKKTKDSYRKALQMGLAPQVARELFPQLSTEDFQLVERELGLST